MYMGACKSTHSAPEITLSSTMQHLITPQVTLQELAIHEYERILVPLLSWAIPGVAWADLKTAKAAVKSKTNQAALQSRVGAAWRHGGQEAVAQAWETRTGTTLSKSNLKLALGLLYNETLSANGQVRG